ncbi:PE family protein [Lentzea fradiae]|uniref:PE family protein n=1 Tax=Lentzea fradiae TaxID=200378 RepID=A0A1G7XTM4_9PSEU|nr:PE domain-containing protein [Lentzea fradiae]SDG87474.1 PE family protein [Lentzea fradiae]
MPFAATAGAGGGSGVTMRVEPDQILNLMTRYEEVRDTLQEFLYRERETLRGKPLAEDDVSRDAAHVFAENAATAIDVTERFLAELTRNIEQLAQAAKTYNLVEDANQTRMRQLDGGV